MIKGYIEIPEKFNKEDIDSKVLLNFLNNVTIKNNKIDLTDFRNYYAKNQKIINILRTELQIRSFNFVLNKENNFLFNLKRENISNEYIFVTSNKNRYKKIDRIIFKNLNFSYIKSDKYFNYIPLELLAEITETKDINMVRNQFKSYGFDIKNPSLENLNENIRDSVILEKSNDSKQEDSLQAYLSKIDNRFISIKNFFNDNKNYTIVNNKNYLSLSDLLSWEYSEEIIYLHKMGINNLNDYKKLTYSYLIDIVGIEKLEFYVYMNKLILKDILKKYSLASLSFIIRYNPQFTILLKDDFNLDEIKLYQVFYCDNEDNLELSSNQLLFNYIDLKELVRLDLGISQNDYYYLSSFKTDSFWDIFNLGLEDESSKLLIEAFYQANLQEFDISLKKNKDYKKLSELFKYNLNTLEKMSYGEVKKHLNILLRVKNIEKINIKNNKVLKYYMKNIDLKDIEEEINPFEKKEIDAILSNDELSSFYDLLYEDLDKYKIPSKDKFLLLFKIFHVYSEVIKSIKKLNFYMEHRKDDITFENIFLLSIYTKQSESLFAGFNEKLHESIKIISLRKEDYQRGVFSSIDINNLMRYFSIEIPNNRYMQLTDNIFENSSEDIKLVLELTQKIKKFNLLKSKNFFLLSVLNEREIKVLESRYIYGLTLEEVGMKLDVTRERVRQIENKALKKINKELKNNRCLMDLHVIFPSGIELYRFEKIVSSDLLKSIFLSNKIQGTFYNDHIKSMFFKDIELEREKYSRFKNTIKLLEVRASREELDYQINKVYQNLTENQYNNIKDYLDIDTLYSSKGEEVYFITSKLRTSDKINIILESKSKPLDIEDKNNLENFQKDYFRLFGEKIDVYNKRNFLGKLSRADECIQLSSNLFWNIKNCLLDGNKISKLIERLDEELDQNILVDSNKLYEMSEELGVNALNNYHIYFYIKKYYENDYKYSSGNSMTISSKGSNATTYPKLIKKILESKEQVSFEDLSKDLGMSKQKLNMVLFNTSDDIVKLDKNIMLKKNLFDLDERSEFEKTIKEEFKEGFSTTNKIFNRIQFNPTLIKWLKKKGIDNHKPLNIAIKEIDSSIRGNQVYLYKENFQCKNLMELLIYRYPERVNINEIEYFLEELYLDNQHKSLLIRDIINGDYYIRMTVDEFLKRELYEYEKNNFNIIQKILSENKEEFVSLNKLLEINSHLFIRSRNTMNVFLLREYMLELGYKEVNRYNHNYSSEYIIMVLADAKIDEFDVLVYHLLKEKYDGEMIEEDIYDFLSSLGLYEKKENTYDKKILNDASHREYINIDYSGRVNIKEDINWN